MTTMTDALKNVNRDVLMQLRDNVVKSQANISSIRSGKQMLIKSIDRQLAPLLTYKSQAEAALADSSTGVGIVPTDVILSSPDLAPLNTSIQRSISAKIELNDNLLFDIGHLQAEKKILQADIAQLDATNSYFSTVLSSINEALAT